MNNGLLLLITAALLTAVAIAGVFLLRRGGRVQPRTGAVAFNRPFSIHFANGQHSRAVYVATSTPPLHVQKYLGLPTGQPTIFAIGGAGGMSAEDVQRTQQLVDVVAAFAQRHGLVVIDGGTEGGIMQMFGDARLRGGYDFPLVGVAPLAQVRWPRHENEAAQADLEDSHSHFVLVDGADWGSESGLIQDLARHISGHGATPVSGILINGGNIAMQEIGMAVERGLPMFVVEGSGRTADAVAAAVRTGTAEQPILRDILAGGSVQFIQTSEPPESITEKLARQYGVGDAPDGEAPTARP